MSDKVNFESLLTAETNISVYEYSDDLEGIELTYAQAVQQLNNGNLILLRVTDSDTLFFYPFVIVPEERAIQFFNPVADGDGEIDLYSPTDNDYLCGVVE